MPTLKETAVAARKSADEKAEKLKTIFEQARGEDGSLDFAKVTSLDGDHNAKVEAFRGIKKEADEAGEIADKAYEDWQVEQDAAKLVDDLGDPTGQKFRQPGSDPDIRHDIAGQYNLGPAEKTIGERFVESDAYKGYRKGMGVGPVASLEMEKGNVKTLFQTSAGWAPETTRTGRMVEEAVRPLQVTDVLPVGRTGQSSVVYMEETTFTNAAAETAEAGTYPEGALELTEQSSPVRKIAVYLPVTDEQLEDVPQVESYIDNRLRFMVAQRLDLQILVGNGVAPNIRGINNQSGVQSQAKGGDTSPDAVHKGMTKVKVTGRARPSSVIMHPNDWQDIRLLRDTNGNYIWGHPAETAAPRIWGIPVVESDAQTENTAVVGDFATHSQLVIRREVDVQISNSHDDFFINGKLAIRADMRVAVIWYRPEAFCFITGI